MSAGTLFDDNLAAIERAIVRVCRDARLQGADAEDFASSARLALLADDCAVLRKFEGRSSMASYLTIVIRRLLFDELRASGRWYASAEAQRRGPVAMQLEKLMTRDRRSFAEAAEIVRRDHPEITTRELEELAGLLPARLPRAVMVPVLEGDEERFAGRASAAERVEALDVERRSQRANEVIRAAMATFTAEDRVILGLRFNGETPIVAIARALGLEQRPLYRRIEALLARLRGALATAGIDASSAEDLIGTPGELLDFGLRRKTADSPPSAQKEGS